MSYVTMLSCTNYEILKWYSSHENLHQRKLPAILMALHGVHVEFTHLYHANNLAVKNCKKMAKMMKETPTKVLQPKST